MFASEYTLIFAEAKAIAGALMFASLCDPRIDYDDKELYYALTDKMRRANEDVNRIANEVMLAISFCRPDDGTSTLGIMFDTVLAKRRSAAALANVARDSAFHIENLARKTKWARFEAILFLHSEQRVRLRSASLGH